MTGKKYLSPNFFDPAILRKSAIVDSGFTLESRVAYPFLQ